MSTSVIDAIFGAMILSEERGDVNSMCSHLRRDGLELIENMEPEKLKEFARFSLRVIDKILVEQQRGPGSLMNWNHPFNKTLIELGVLKEPSRGTA